MARQFNGSNARTSNPAIEPNDGNAVPGWQRLHELALNVFSATKAIRDTPMSEGVKQTLDAMFS